LQERGFFREIKPASGRRPAILTYGEILNTAEAVRYFDAHPIATNIFIAIKRRNG